MKRIPIGVATVLVLKLAFICILAGSLVAAVLAAKKGKIKQDR